MFISNYIVENRMSRVFRCMVTCILISTHLFAQEKNYSTTKFRFIGVDFVYSTMSDTEIEKFSDCSFFISYVGH